MNNAQQRLIAILDKHRSLFEESGFFYYEEYDMLGWGISIDQDEKGHEINGTLLDDHEADAIPPTPRQLRAACALAAAVLRAEAFRLMDSAPSFKAQLEARHAFTNYYNEADELQKLFVEIGAQQ